MTDSDISKEILEIIENAGPHIETGAAFVGLLTEYVKLINEKVPLKDLLMEIGVFIKSEIVPVAAAAEQELFRERKITAEGWLDVYEAAVKRGASIPGGPEMAKEITLQMMRASAEVARNMSQKSLLSINAASNKK